MLVDKLYALDHKLFYYYYGLSNDNITLTVKRLRLNVNY